MGALRHPWRTLVSRNRGSGIGTQTGSRRRRGRGRGVGRRGGEPPGAAPRLFPPPPPSRRRAHCLRPGSSRSRRSSHRRLQVPAALSGPGGGATTPPRPGPPSKAWGLLDSWPCPACSPSWGRFPRPSVGDRPRAPGDGGVQCFRATERLHEVQRNLGHGKLDPPPPTPPNTHTTTPEPGKGGVTPMVISGERRAPLPMHTGISPTPAPPYSPASKNNLITRCSSCERLPPGRCGALPH